MRCDNMFTPSSMQRSPNGRHPKIVDKSDDTLPEKTRRPWKDKYKINKYCYMT